MPELQRREGDWEITSDRLRVVVAEEGEGRPPRGTLVDLTTPDAEADDLLEHDVVLAFGAQRVPLRVRSLGSELRDGRPVVRIERRSEDGALAIWTEIGLLAGQGAVELHHRVYNRTDGPLSGLRLGEQIRFAGRSIFLPGEGPVEAPMRVSAPFIAWAGKLRSYASVRPAGPVEVDCRFEPHGPLDQVVYGPAFDLAAGEGAFHADHRLLVVASGGLPSVARAVWSRLGVALGRLHGQLPRASLPATVEAALPNRGAFLVTPADDRGRFELLLPAGSYRVVARTPGGADIQQVTIAAGRSLEILEIVPPRPGYLQFQVRDRQGSALPARVVVRGVWPTRDPSFGPHHLASGAGNVVYAAEGRGEVPLPGGRFVVTATHGPEFSIAEHRLRVQAGQGRFVRFVLEREVDTTGWLAAELHLHAAPSPDSEVSLLDRVTSLLAEGVEIAVATDHNHVSDYRPIIDSLQARDRLLGVPGVEVTTADPHWGHFNVFPYPYESDPPVVEGLSPADFFPILRERAPAGLIQVNHPRMGIIGYFNQTELDPRRGLGGVGYSPDFDAIEIWNGMDLGKGEVLAKTLSDWFALLNSGARYTATGSSDSHQLLFQWAGYPRTYVQVSGAEDRPDAVEAEQVAAALRQGRAIVTSGPFVEVRANGAGIGDLAAAPGGQVELKVSVRAAGWVDVRRVEIVVNGRVAHVHPVRDGATSRAERAGFTRTLSLDGDSWIVVLVRGEKSLDVVLPHSKGIPAAITNPIFVDVDGDGSFLAPGARRPLRDGSAGVLDGRDAPTGADSAAGVNLDGR